ncbi:hypothetical protein [Texcoconibacillus texcoconensis]|uniref:Energy-coupling factor transport system permease protein n=1 Tax=Texcoconibacillus texcoconensis TaxID=1095777 RepID=A0A840QSL3_9BACI|nr:hypothetical protein [Texcoconibacillus texcoconensis]MBB5174309.1 energy-coupling factor transport system permease protein [Texcoconibacillus texcoconensis]
MRWKNKGFWPIDSGYKFFIAVTLGVIPFFIDHYLSFILLSLYLFLSTYIYGARLREMMKSMVAYLIIIIVPYMFGLLMATVVSTVSGTDMSMVYGSYQDVGLRLVQLFLLWYATSLFFFSTPTEEIVGVFDRVLTPLKRLGVPVRDFLKVIMCVVNELKHLGPGVKESFTNSMTKLSEKSSWRTKIRVISNILVAFIVDSFKRLDEVEEYVNQVEAEDLFTYKVVISKSELFLFISFVALLYTFFFLETYMVV